MQQCRAYIITRMENNSLLSKLNDLEARFQEVSTLITDPSVVADMKRFVRLNKEYRELEQILDARKRYICLLMRATPNCAKWHARR